MALITYNGTSTTFINFAAETFIKMDIIFASNNTNKIREINNVLGNSFRLLSLKDIDLEQDIPEDETTLEGNALQKARYVYNVTGRDVFADDTGLEVDALGGRPGVHSARFAGEAKDPESNIEKLLSLMKDVSDRKARFRTVIALIFKEREYLFEGVVNGKILKEKHGNEGFGYDPVFQPDGSAVTFAEMPLDEKNKISHRARAFAKLKLFLENHE